MRIIRTARPKAQPAALPDSIPQNIRDRLAAEGIHSSDDWLALGRRRFTIFGITRKAAIQIDALVSEGLGMSTPGSLEEPGG